MLRQHVRPLLSAYCHDALAPQEAQRVGAHLLVCPRCRAAYEEIKLGVALARQLPPAPAPATLWADIAAALAPDSPQSVAAARHRCHFARFTHWPRATAAGFAALVCAALVSAWLYLRPAAATWEVARLAGAPQVGAERIADRGQLAIGEWLETDANSRAKLNVAHIGQVELEPATRVRLVETRPTEHRLELARGTLHATIWAPPRLFFVDTPSAVAADLGCAYTLEVDDAGRSLLHVTSGWVALAAGAHESLVPAGAACATAPGTGPGTPFFEDAPDKFLQALTAYDFRHGGDEALTTVLTQARARDTLTLWHLLARADGAQRPRVYERLAALSSPPSGVTRAGVLELDAHMLALWKDDLETHWLQESFPAVRKVWRNLWH